jgi:beta-phosphoglucomutase-like phosphatase (HAD superfamily)
MRALVFDPDGTLVDTVCAPEIDASLAALGIPAATPMEAVQKLRDAIGAVIGQARTREAGPHPQGSRHPLQLARRTGVETQAERR